MENEINQQYTKNDSLVPIRASSVEDAVSQFREILLEKEKMIPNDVPHTVWIYGCQIEWDYFN